MTLSRTLNHVAAEHSSMIAVEQGAHRMTYTGLYRKAAQIDLLLDRLPDASGPVTVMCRSALNAIPIMIACVMSGRSYLPVDVANPPRRVEQLMRRSGSVHLVSDCLRDAYGTFLTSPSRLDSQMQVCSLRGAVPDASPALVQWAYHLYTSGSTGTPKGVLHTSSDIVNMVKAYTGSITLGEKDRVAMFSSLGHDAAVVDVYSCLLTGATLVAVDASSPLSLKTEVPRVLRSGVTVWHCVPTVLDMVASQFSGEGLNDLRVVLGGEPVSRATLENLWVRVPSARIFSLYGQTECSVISGKWIEPDDTALTLGDPLKGVEWREGQGSGNGPHHLLVRSDAAATHRVVDGDPLPLENCDGWFDTGDVVTAHGNSFTFLGRADQVVNIGGCRVDILEVEEHVKKCPGVEDCVVFLDDSGAPGPALKCLARGGENIAITDINAFLSKRVPHHLLLRSFVTTDALLPRTLSGKKDRRAAVRIALEQQ